MFVVAEGVVCVTHPTVIMEKGGIDMHVAHPNYVREEIMIILHSRSLTLHPRPPLDSIAYLLIFLPSLFILLDHL